MLKGSRNYTTLELRSLLKKLFCINSISTKEWKLDVQVHRDACPDCPRYGQSICWKLSIRAAKAIKARILFKADGGNGHQQYDVTQGYDEGGFISIKKEDLFGEDNGGFPIIPLGHPTQPMQPTQPTQPPTQPLLGMSVTPSPGKILYRSHISDRVTRQELMNKELVPFLEKQAEMNRKDLEKQAVMNRKERNAVVNVISKVAVDIASLFVNTKKSQEKRNHSGLDSGSNSNKTPRAYKKPKAQAQANSDSNKSDWDSLIDTIPNRSKLQAHSKLIFQDLEASKATAKARSKSTAKAMSKSNPSSLKINLYLQSTINHQPSTINHRPSTINHQPSTINNQPSTINHQPSTINHQPSVDCQSEIRKQNFHRNCSQSRTQSPAQQLNVPTLDRLHLQKVGSHLGWHISIRKVSVLLIHESIQDLVVTNSTGLVVVQKHHHVKHDLLISKSCSANYIHLGTLDKIASKLTLNAESTTRTFDVTEDHDSHRIVVDYARATNRLAGKKNIRRVQNLECLSRGPRKRWNETLAGREIEHTKEGFKSTMRAYVNAITPDPDAKGTMIASFEHQHMAKLHGTELIPSSTTSTCYPGDDDNDLTEQQRKRMFFKTHPRSWQDAYMDTAVNFRETDKACGRILDRDADPEEAGTPTKAGDMCRNHPQGNHTWEQCYMNPRNQNAPYPSYVGSDGNSTYSGQSNYYGGGQGQAGQFNGGRGRGGRFNRGRGRFGGRSNNNNNSGASNTNESNHNWEQNHGDAFSNITASNASYFTSNQDSNSNQYKGLVPAAYANESPGPRATDETAGGLQATQAERLQAEHKKTIGPQANEKRTTRLQAVDQGRKATMNSDITPTVLLKIKEIQGHKNNDQQAVDAIRRATKTHRT
eukprot:jgi/Psemu1/22923/gm1.22923_g